MTDEAGTRRVLRAAVMASEVTLEAVAGSSWLDGSHAVSEVALIDRSGRLTRYARSGAIITVPALRGAPASHAVDLGAQDFVVTGGAVSAAMPVLRSVMRTAPPALEQAGRAVFTVGYSPGVEPVRSIALTLLDPSGNPRTVTSGPGTNGQAVLSVAAAPGWPAGEYRVNEVSFVDAAGRVVRYGRGGVVTVLPARLGAMPPSDLDLAASDFRLTGSFEAAQPVVAELSPAVAASAPESPRLVNLVLMARLAAGESLDAGFVLDTSGRRASRPVLLRAVGPSLAGLGMEEGLADPVIELMQGGTLVARNDNWGGDLRLRGSFARVGAFPLMSADSADAALLADIPAGRVQSVRVSGAAGAAGLVLFELHEDAGFDQAPRIVGFSTLHRADSGFTTGFSLAGEGRRTMVIRAIGPGLAALGVKAGLADPVLTLMGAGEVVLGRNDDWKPEDAGAMAAAGLFALPRGSLDSALVLDLAAGAYTVRIDRPGSEGGRVLLEIHDVPRF